MISIYQAQGKEDLEHARELFFEFLTWAIEKSKELYNEDIDINKMVNYSMSEIDKDIFSPPRGRLMLAKEGNQAAGSGAYGLHGIRIIKDVEVGRQIGVMM